MAREEWKELSEAKKSHRSAAAGGNRREEAKWANVIGNIYKNRGDFANAIKWLSIDYNISSHSLSPHHLYPSCQSLGDTFLLLKDFQNALFYQKKHLELAKDENNLVEQQRANTQLGRTYHDMLTQDKYDHNSVRSAKKYFKCALELARILKENPPKTPDSSSFVREYIDAHNNMGMLEMDLENFQEARKMLAKGIAICTEEEFPVNDATRTRLHNNIGAVYMHLRVWDKAKKHMESDIKICNRIGHCEGEAKGYINYGLVHYKTQRYEEALECYKRASNLAKSMEGNSSLLEEIDQNIESAKEAEKIMADLRKAEQHLKKLIRDANSASGKPGERKCLLQVNAFLDSLIDKARTIEFWPKFREFGKRKKIITSKIYDKEKLSESYFILGEAYSNLRNFDKACKWYSKSLEIYKSIGNLEEQARINNEIGNALDSKGDWKNALEAYKESYRIAVEAKHPSVQLLALENMHYCHLIRFGDDDETRRLQLEIKKLKQSKYTEFEKYGAVENFCSETDSEGGIHVSEDKFDTYCSSNTSGSVEEDDEAPLASLCHSTRSSPKLKPTCKEQENNAFTASSSKSGNSHQSVGRKRGRLILSDDDDETFCEVKGSKARTQNSPKEDVGTSDEFKIERNTVDPKFLIQDESAVDSKSTNPAHIEESCSSFRSTGPIGATQNGKPLGPASPEDECIAIKINNELMQVKASLFAPDISNIESVKAELACLYYLQLPEEKRSDGLVPVILYIKCGDRVIESLEMIETLKDDMGKGFIEALVDAWVHRRLIKSYVDGCKELSEKPNIKLLKKLYDLKVSDDEINIFNCELQDLSITPFLNALFTHTTFAVLNLSHNLLGNGTMEKLQQVFTSSSQKYGGLTLDLHCNLFGPTALVQICECPSLFTRLEVLNISGNRITNSSASCLETILKKFRALCSLNIDGCCIGSRTIVKIIDALDSESALEHLFIGHNNAITAGAVVNLLLKLSTLKRFSELGLNGLKLSKPVLDGLCLLAKKCSSFSALMLGETSLGNDYASVITKVLCNGTNESVKLDLSNCRLTCDYVVKLNADVSHGCCILELNLAGNPIAGQGSSALSSLLLNPHCCLKVLVLEKCLIGLAGILQILDALAENVSLEDLNLADNADLDQCNTPPDSTAKEASTELLQPMSNIPEGVEAGQQGLNDDLIQLEVADSEEGPSRVEGSRSGIDDSCASSSQRSHETQFTLEISTAISKAKTLQLLDLSNNGFPVQVAQKLYVAWSSSRLYPGYCHVENQTIHLVTKGRKCCIKPCCKTNLL